MPTLCVVQPDGRRPAPSVRSGGTRERDRCPGAESQSGTVIGPSSGGGWKTAVTSASMSLNAFAEDIAPSVSMTSPCLPQNGVQRQSEYRLGGNPCYRAQKVCCCSAAHQR